jgi:signal transduction histidine kinase
MKMHFRVSARTVLELGSELISSDEVALYELVKNSIDAKSKTGVEIDFHICLSYSAYSEVMRELVVNAPRPLTQIKDSLLSRVEATAEPEVLEVFKDELSDCKTLPALKKKLPQIYADTNWIEIRDTGTGMSAQDIKTKYLVIGTPARKKEIELAEVEFSAKGGNGDAPETPYLGEKGVGRLSAMRLGWMLHLESATERDTLLNEVDIDWRRFEDLDLEVQDIEIEPTLGVAKPSPKWSGTTIRISGLSGNWSPRRIRDVATAEFAKLSDPFSLGKRRFRIAVFFNGERVEIPRMDNEILAAAHATVKASYKITRGSPILDVYMTFKGPERTEDKHLRFGRMDLSVLTDDANEEIPDYALRTVGPFEYEAYWYNRQKLRGIDSIGNLNTVRELQRRWSGIMLFRDGYRVLPYGEDKDDWLGLDRKALASPGYKLNKAQFIGRVQISRLGNPYLTDQTNREGLKETPEKYVFVEILRYVTQNLLRNFMDEVGRSQRHVEIDVAQVEERISTLESRARESIRRLKTKHRESSLELQDMQEMFDQMKEYFEQARDLAEQAEDERTRLIQLAGIGLMLEVVAHELARSTETAMMSLTTAQTRNLPTDIASTLKILRTEMQTMNKRLRVLDPLSISGRQRRETFDLVGLVEDTFSGRLNQFKRHGIDAKVKVKGGNSLTVTGVKGMYVQIIENMTSNSVFWLKKRAAEDPFFSPEIRVDVDARFQRLSFRDNGPGISEGLKEDIFKPFFSTKDRRRRQGLGLYIARECAIHNGARLFLSDEHSVHDTRLNTFVLELPSNA